jgi:TusA-related sulfurtransferase
MASYQTLDLTEVLWPESLLQCKSQLEAMNPGREIDILVKDLDVVKSLTRIIERSQCSIMKRNRNGDCYQMHVRKT